MIFFGGASSWCVFILLVRGEEKPKFHPAGKNQLGLAWRGKKKVRGLKKKTPRKRFMLLL